MHSFMGMQSRITTPIQIPTPSPTPLSIMTNGLSPISVVTGGCSLMMNHDNGSQGIPSTVSTASLNSIGYKEEDNFIKKVNVAQIKVKMNISSLRTKLEWPKPITKHPVMFIVDFTVKNGRRVTTRINNPAPLVEYEIKTVPGNFYFVHIQCKSLDGRFLVAEWSKEIRAEMSFDEYNSLYAKCIVFMSKDLSSMQQFQRIYRCKPDTYWDQIFFYSNEIMQKYIKDENGQPGNLINGQLKGLFFSANVNSNGQMPNTSWFGNIRMDCDAFMFLNPGAHNFYFADFYCNTNRHYVTIVICVKKSESDVFCQEKKLIKLDPFNNPFVKLVSPTNNSPSLKFFLNKTIIVELFYTEDIHLHSGLFTRITPSGAGRSRTYGVPNNKDCTDCNLYPRRRQNSPMN